MVSPRERTSNMKGKTMKKVKRNGCLLLGGAMVLVTSLASCGGDEDSNVGSSSETVSTEADGSGIEVTGAWARTSPSMVAAGAVYMTIEVGSDDQLLAVAVDPTVAGMAQVHETVMASTTTSSMNGSSMSAPMSGEMSMQEVDHIDLRAGVPFELAPGGFHVMLMDLVTPLELGSTFEITLRFAVAGEVVVPVEVLAEAP